VGRKNLDRVPLEDRDTTFESLSTMVDEGDEVDLDAPASRELYPKFETLDFAQSGKQ
jgi:hypothetical protein